MRPGHRCHVLYIPYNQADFRLVQIATQGKRNIILEKAESPEKALDLIRNRPFSNRPNLILMSWILNGSSGEAFLKSIKADNELRCIPVVVFTSGINWSDVGPVYGMGASCVVERPPELDAFLDSMEKLYSFWGSVAQLPYCQTEGAAVKQDFCFESSLRPS